MINVSIVEAHSVQRIGLKTLLGADPSITVVSVSDHLQRSNLQAADVLLLSFCSVCDFPSVELVSGLSQRIRVVLFSGKETSISLLAYQNTAVQALLHQSASEEEVLCSIRAAKSAVPGSSDRAPVTGGSELSPRETLVLALVGDGYTNDQIARRIGISKHTVDTYIRRVRRKLDLGNKAQLARAATHLAATWALPRSPSAPEQAK